ncbi:MAG TPA: hypothetical protein PK880_01385 [Candidatus Competibacter sp.]|nr:hypothetical protein [Candidatus Competibacter sp.]
MKAIIKSEAATPHMPKIEIIGRDPDYRPTAEANPTPIEDRYLPAMAPRPSMNSFG